MLQRPAPEKMINMFFPQTNNAAGETLPSYLEHSETLPRRPTDSPGVRAYGAREGKTRTKTHTKTNTKTNTKTHTKTNRKTNTKTKIKTLLKSTLVLGPM